MYELDCKPAQIEFRVYEYEPGRPKKMEYSINIVSIDSLKKTLESKIVYDKLRCTNDNRPLGADLNEWECLSRVLDLMA